jgi:prefoldin subunit 5
MPYPPPAPAWGPHSPDDEVEMLQGQADWLKEQLEAINERLQELQQQKKEG